MRKMKDSGVEWIGEIPEEWEVVPMKRFIERRDGGAWGEEPKNNLNDIICIRIADFDYARFSLRKNNSFTIRNYDSQTISRLLLMKGDILVEKSGGGENTPVGRSIIFQENFLALYANFMDRIRISNNYSNNFFQYVWVIFYLNGYSRMYIKQTTGIQNLDIKSLLARESIVFPSLNRQNCIVDYLDRKCAQIDAIITKQQEIIEMLKLYKQSVITEAVTKGLDPDVPMKDSGIEWIGEIPVHWYICKFGRKIVIKSNLVNPTQYLEYFQVSPENIEKNSGKLSKCNTVRESGIISWNHLFFKGQILYSKIRPILNKVTIAPFDGLCSADMYPIESEMDKGFTVYVMLSSYFIFHVGLITQNRVKMPKINQVELSNITIVVPPINEQKKITNYLNDTCTKIDSFIEKKQTLIDKLTQYKKSLIYEAVTGKLEV